MWAIVKDNKVVEVISSQKPVIIDEIQHPKEIFISWTDEERKAIGVVPYVYEGDSVNAMFYTSSESSPVVSSDKVVVTITKAAKSVSSVKTAMKEIVSSSLGRNLSETDWIVVREQDNGTAKPSDLAKWRTDLRSKAAALKTAIDSKSDVASLEAMTVLTEEMKGAGKKHSEFDDWPQNPRLIGE
jgi:hypothetical protein